MLNASIDASKRKRFRANDTNARRLPTSERIRSDLFHKLGISNTIQADAHSQRTRSNRSLLGDVLIYREPLKYVNQEAPIMKHSDSWLSFFQVSSTSPNTVVSEPDTKKLSFNTEVAVIPIPTRHDYSDRVKERLWIAVDELELAAYRNAVEFTAEGWDWRTVLEDEAFYRCSETGEKIHPVHMEPEDEE